MRGYVFFFVCAVLLGQGTTSYYDFENESNMAPETAELLKIHRDFFILAPGIIKSSVQNMPPEMVASFETLLETYLTTEPETTAIDCAGCVSGIATVTAAIKSGMEYDTMVAIAEVICRELMDSQGYHGDIICPGAVGNFAPHVIYILNVTDKTPRQICTQYNYCTAAGPGQEREWVKKTPLPNTETQASKPKTRRSGTKRSLAGAIKLVHVNDIHLEDMFAPGSPTNCGLHVCCKNYNTGEGTAGIWGDWNCNSKPGTAEYMLEYVAAMNPDIVINAGDNPPNTVWEETQERQLYINHLTAKMLERIFPGVPTYATIGNHDLFPVNMYFIERPQVQEVNMEFFNDYAKMSGFGAKQLQTIRDGGWYSVLFRPGLRVISFNTNLGHTDNYYNVLNDDTAENFNKQAVFLNTELESARNAGEKVLLIGHHPSGGGSTFLYFSHLMRDLGLEYGDIIVYYAQGHNHGDLFKTVVDKATNKTMMVQFSGPSVTSSHVVNPSARLVYLDPVTFEALDYDQFYLDLPAANAGSVPPQCPGGPSNAPGICSLECQLSYHCAGVADRCCPSNCGGHMCISGHVANANPEIKLAYRFTEEYGVPDATPASFGLLIDKLELDRSLHDIYRYHGKTQTNMHGTCSDACHANDICNMRTSSLDDYRECQAG